MVGGATHEAEEGFVNALLHHAPELAEVPRAGNPFFVEEVVRTLIDDSLIVRDESGTQWLATGRGEAFNIPSNVQALLTARIDRLEEETRS